MSLFVGGGAKRPASATTTTKQEGEGDLLPETQNKITHNKLFKISVPAEKEGITALTRKLQEQLYKLRRAEYL